MILVGLISNVGAPNSLSRYTSQPDIVPGLEITVSVVELSSRIKSSLIICRGSGYMYFPVRPPMLYAEFCDSNIRYITSSYSVYKAYKSSWAQ